MIELEKESIEILTEEIIKEFYNTKPVDKTEIVRLISDFLNNLIAFEMPPAAEEFTKEEECFHNILEACLAADRERQHKNNNWIERCQNARRQGWYIAFLNNRKDIDFIFSNDSFNPLFWRDEDYQQQVQKGNYSNYIKQEQRGYNLYYDFKPRLLIERTELISNMKKWIGISDDFPKIDFSDIESFIYVNDLFGRLYEFQDS